jgi:hypothetical protein
MGEYTNYLSIVTLDQDDTQESPKYNSNEIFSTYFNGNPTKGLVFDQATQSGDQKLQIKTANVYSDEKYKWINSFKIEKDPSDAWKVTQETEDKQDQRITYKNSGKTLFLIFYVTTGKEIYTTTGNIIFDAVNKVISTNSVFHLLDSDSEFRPNYNMLSIGTGAPAETIAELKIEQLSKEITKANLIYYLTCVKDILTSKAFNYVKNEEIYKMFLSILMVNIKLTDDLNLNSAFLEEFVKHVNNEIVKTPVRNILYVMDEISKNKINPYQVYISGLDLPKIMLKMKDEKFKTIIDETVAEYSKTITNSFDKLFSTQSTDLSKLAENTIKSLMEEVYELTKSPKVFVRINVKKIGETENAVNSRFVLKTDRSHKYLSVSAVKSAKQLYEIEEAKIKPLYENINATGEITFDAANNKIVNESGGRKLNHVFGEFDGIFNYDMNNKDIANDTKMTQLIDDLMLNKILFIIGYGASGAGKTSSLVYYNKGKTIEEKTGIIIQMCLLMNGKGCKKISMKRVELCGQNCDQPDAIPEEKYDFNWRGEPQSFFCDSEVFIEKHPDRIAKEKVCLDENKTQPANTCSIKDKSLGEVAELLIDKDRHVDATTNNTNSSRSHSLLVVTFYISTNQDGVSESYEEYNLIIGDFAGVENLFNCGSTKIIKDFANLNKDQTAQEKLEKNPTTRYYNNQSNLENRGPVYDFADKQSLFGIVGDNNSGNVNVSSEFKYSKDLWIDDIYTVLNGFNPNNNLLKNGNDNFISLFENNNSKTYPIINRFNENGNVTLSTEPFNKIEIWKKGNNIVDPQLPDYHTLKVNLDSIDKGKLDKGNIKPETGSSVKYKIEYTKQNNSITLTSYYDKKVDTDITNNPNGVYTKIAAYPKPPQLNETNYENTMKQILNINGNLTCTVPTTENYTKYYDEYNNWNTNHPSIEDAFKNETINFTFYVTYTVNDQQMPIKYTLTGPKKSFEVKDDNQKKADAMIGKWIKTHTANTIIEKTLKVNELFVTDAARILEEIKKFNAVKVLIEPICILRSEEGKYINTELQNLTEAIEAIYIYKNNGRPPLKKPIPGNNDFFYKKHIFNVLNNVSYNEQKLTTVLEKSSIIKAIYNCVKPQGYSQFANSLSVVYFCVFSWSCDTEKENKIQYIEINALYNLLQECNYDYELGEIFLDKKSNYLETLKKAMTVLTTYFTDNKMNEVSEIKSLLINIRSAYAELNNATAYIKFITSLRGIVKEIDDLNATTAVGTLHTVSKIINGVNGDIVQTEDLNKLINQSLEI